MLPGERGDRLSTARLTSGRLPLEANLWAQLQEVAARGPTGATPPVRQADGTSTAIAPAAAVAAPLLAPTGPATWKMATRLQHPVTKNEDPYAGVTARGMLRVSVPCARRLTLQPVYVCSCVATAVSDGDV
jgi:hypothetical protein